MKLSVVGASHHVCPLSVRERFFLSRKKRDIASRFLKETRGVSSFFILSTCNRSEIYLWSDRLISEVEIFCNVHGMDCDEIAPFLYVHTEQAAWRHLIRVGCGLDSQILGEPQILSQINSAVTNSAVSSNIDPEASSDIYKALRIIQNVRNDVGAHCVSENIADKVFNIIRKNEPAFRKKRYLLIGTGKIAELFLPVLVREGLSPVVVSNKNYEKAIEWANKLGGKAVRLNNLSALIHSADIVITATSSPHAVLHGEYFCGVQKPGFIFDLAVPRDADPAIRSIPGVRLYDLDEVGSLDAREGQQEWVHVAELKAHNESIKLWSELSELGQEKVLLR